MELTEYRISTGHEIDMRLAFVADLHDDRDYAKYLDIIKSKNVDMILSSGDILHDGWHFDNALAFIREAVRICPFVTSIGNHEFKVGFDAAAKYRECGATVLDDQTLHVGELTIGGLTSGFGRSVQGWYKRTPPPDTEYIASFSGESGYRILLNHHPEYYKKYLQNVAELILSGHAHGGQWRVFGQGIYAPGQFIFPKYTSGMYDGRLIVSRGMHSEGFIPRIFNDTQLIFVNLQR
ncbi:MAG: metallophosphoesterase [Clostridia bacterium]|nr:metallophosphoesterase [Clostridia bacterium]